MADVATKARPRRKTAGTAPGPEPLAPSSAPKRPKRLVVAAPKGGVGKTTLALNMGVVAAHRGISVATVDFELSEQANLSRWRADRPEKMPQFDNYSARMDEVAEVLETITDYDLIICDTPPGMNAITGDLKELVAAADFVLVPSDDSRFSRESVIDWMAALRRMAKPHACVMNHFKRNALTFGKTKLMLDRAGRLCPVEIPDSQDMKNCIEVGLGVIEIRGAKVRSEVELLWDFVRYELGMTGAANG